MNNSKSMAFWVNQVGLESFPNWSFDLGVQTKQMGINNLALYLHKSIEI